MLCYLFCIIFSAHCTLLLQKVVKAVLCISSHWCYVDDFAPLLSYSACIVWRAQCRWTMVRNPNGKLQNALYMEEIPKKSAANLQKLKTFSFGAYFLGLIWNSSIMTVNENIFREIHQRTQTLSSYHVKWRGSLNAGFREKVFFWGSNENIWLFVLKFT